MDQEDLRYQFGPFSLSTHAGVLYGADGEIKLRPQAFRVLLYLVEQHTRIIPRDELLDEVWGSEHLSTNSLPQVISELRQALADDSRQPRYIATVHRRGYRFVAPVTRRKVAPAPLGTPAPAPSAGPALTTGAPGDAASAPRQPARAALAVSLALISAALVGWLAVRGPGSTSMPAGAAATSVERRLVVLPLQHTAEDPDAQWLSTALADAISDALGQTRNLAVLAPTRVARAQADLELAVSRALSPATLQRVYRRTGARWVVTGAISPLADASAMRLEVTVTDATDEAFTASHVSEFAREQWSDAVSHAAADLRELLALPPPDALRSGAALITAPTNLDASAQYHRALTHLRHFELSAAHQALARAAGADPESAAIQHAIAQVHQARGQRALARTHAQQALQLAAAWRQADQLPLRASALALADQPAAAADLYRRAYETHADLAMGLKLAASQREAGRGQSALETLRVLREGATNHADQILIALEVATVAESIGEFARQRDAAQEALTLAAQLGAQWYEGQARRQLGAAQLRLGDAQASSAYLSRAFDMLQLLGDLPNASRAAGQWAQALMDTGALELARSKLDQALALAEQAEHAGLIAEHTSHLGGLALHAGEGERASAMHHDALTRYASLGDRRGEAEARLRFADGVARGGDFDHALDLMRESRRLFQEVGDLHGEARAWDMLGAMLGRSGSLDAQRHFERALELYRESGDRRGEADALGHLANQYSHEGQFEPAVTHMSQALELYQRIPSKRGAAKVMYNLSLIHLKMGTVTEASRLLDAAHRTFAELDLAMNAAWVQRKYGDLLMHQGQLGEARSALDAALQATREAGAKGAIAHALSSLGDLAVFEGDRVAGVALHTEARDMREAMRQYGNAAANEMALVRLALDRGDLAEAQRALETAAAALETNSQGWRSVVLALQARLDAARGLPELARTALAQADAAFEESGSEDASMRLTLDLELGRALGAIGDHEAALQTLVRVQGEAERFGFVARAMEASLARFDVLADAAGSPHDEQPALEALARQADAAGFVSIAERALALARIAEAGTARRPKDLQVN